jgi:hypothetical protein
MPYVLNNVTTADTYTQGNTLACQSGVRVNIHVFNAGIFFAMGSAPGVNPGVQTQQEIFRAPGLYSMDRNLDQIQFRSAAKGVPAQVTCDVWRAGELSG